MRRGNKYISHVVHLGYFATACRVPGIVPPWFWGVLSNICARGISKHSMHQNIARGVYSSFLGKYVRRGNKCIRNSIVSYVVVHFRYRAQRLWYIVSPCFSMLAIYGMCTRYVLYNCTLHLEMVACWCMSLCKLWSIVRRSQWSFEIVLFQLYAILKRLPIDCTVCRCESGGRRLYVVWNH